MMKFHVEHFSELASTSSMISEHAKQGAAEGLVIWTDFQTEGRGKPGHKWQAPKGKDLLFSLLVRPPISPSKAPLLTQVACRSVAVVLKDCYDIDTSFKRPNDIMVGDKKICGVLVESSSRTQDRIDCAILGIGLNVNAESEEIFSTGISMKMLKNRDYSREEVLHAVLKQLSQDLLPLYGANSGKTQ